MRQDEKPGSCRGYIEIKGTPRYHFEHAKLDTTNPLNMHPVAKRLSKPCGGSLSPVWGGGCAEIEGSCFWGLYNKGSKVLGVSSGRSNIS